MKNRTTHPDHTDSPIEHGSGRRRALRALAVVGGAAVVSKWSKPVIDSVVLPAHAQATGGFTGAFAGTLATVVSRNWLDALVPKANAGTVVCGGDNGQPICISINNNAVEVTVNTSAGVVVQYGTLVGDMFNITFGAASSINGTLNGAQNQITGQVVLECVSPFRADAGGAFTGERIDVASLQLAGVVIITSQYNYTADLNALCPIGPG